MGREKWKRKRKIFNLHVEKDAGVLSRGYSFHRFDWFARKLLPARYQRPADCKNSRNDESGGGDERREKEKKKWQRRIYRHTEIERGIVKYSVVVTSSSKCSIISFARHLLLFLILLLFLFLFSFFFFLPIAYRVLCCASIRERARRDNSRHFQICRCQGIGKNNSPSIAIDQSARRQKLRSKKNIGNNAGRKLLAIG